MRNGEGVMQITVNEASQMMSDFEICATRARENGYGEWARTWEDAARILRNRKLWSGAPKVRARLHAEWERACGFMQWADKADGV